MSKMMKVMKSALCALGVASFALGAWAGTLSVDYTLYLKGGKAYDSYDYKTETFGNEVLGLADKGMSYADGVWTMKDFTFETTSLKGIVCLDEDEAVVKLVGDNSIKTSDSDTSGAFGMSAIDCPSFTIFGEGSDSLTVTAGDYTGKADKLSSEGISAVTLLIRNATVTVTSGDVGTGENASSYGITAENLVVIDATVTATGKQAGSRSAGACVVGPITILGTGKVTASSLSTSGDAYGVFNDVVTEPAAVAKDGSDNVLTYDTKKGAYFAYGSTTEYATKVILNEGGVANYSIHLKNGKAYLDAKYKNEITSAVAAKGLAYADGVWTMTNFTFTTRALAGLDFCGDGTIDLQGVNAVTAGSMDGTDESQYGMLLDGLNMVITGNGSLAVTAMPTKGNAAFGIACNGSLTVTGGAQLKAVSHCTGKGQLGLGVFGDLTIGNATIEVSNAGQIGTRVTGNTSVSGTLTTKGGLIGFGSDTNAVPDAVATDADTGAPLYFADVGSVFAYTNDTEMVFCSNVLMRAVTPPVQIKATPTSVDNATFKVYADGVESAGPDYLVWSNGTATVVYTANAGYIFSDGSAVVTNALDTTVDPAKNAAGETLPAAKENTYFVTFSASEPFGIQMRKEGTPTVKFTLECSTDKAHWTAFDWENGATAGADNKLFLRGTGNTAFAAGVTKFYAFTNTATSAATAITCSGNVMTLLDYATVAKGEEPTMGSYAFACLFHGFASLTAAPDLPAKNLTQFCYNSMFQYCTSLAVAPELSAETLALGCYQTMFSGCTSLTAAPELSAETLTDYCYNTMFVGCTSLTKLPALPATNLANYCYLSMFKKCSSLKVNKEGPGLEWKIPATDDTGISAWGADMFKDTAGTLTGTPALNTTYYVIPPSELIEAEVTPVANTTYEIYTNDVLSAEGKVWSYQPATVVYAADAGYVFSDGSPVVTNDLDTTVNPAVDRNPPVVLVQRSVITNGEIRVLVEGTTYTAPATTEKGGVFYLDGGAKLVGTNVSFVGNSAGQGGAIYSDRGELNLFGDVVFSGNTSKDGTGGALITSGNVTIDGDVTFTNNAAIPPDSDLYGGAVEFLSGASMTVLGKAVFACNRSGHAGAVNVNAGCKLHFVGETFWIGNAASRSNGDGGALYNKGEIVFDTKAVFSGNSAKNKGGAIFNWSWNSSPTVTFRDELTLATDTDTIYNKTGGKLVWDLTNGGKPCLNGFQRVINDINDNGTLQLATEGRARTGSFVIATGDFTDLAGKDTFVVSDGTDTFELTVNGGTVVTNGTLYRLTTDATSLVLSVGDAETIAVDSTWADKKVGEEVKVGDKTYLYGVNAYSDAQTAVNAMMPGMKTIVFVGNEASYGNVDFSKAEGLSAITVFTEGKEALFGRFNQTGAKKYTPNITIGEGSVIKADDLGIWEWDVGSDIDTQTVTLDKNSKLTLTNMYEGSTEFVSLLSNGRLVMNEGSVLKLAYGLELLHGISIWNGDVSVTANSATIEAGGSLIANKRCYFTLNDSTATFPYVHNDGSITLNNSTFCGATVSEESAEDKWVNFYNNAKGTVTLNDSLLTVDHLHNEGTFSLNRSTVSTEGFVFNSSGAKFAVTNGEVKASYFENAANHFWGYAEGLEANTTYAYQLFEGEVEVGNRVNFDSTEFGDYHFYDSNTTLTGWKVYDTNGVEITEGVTSDYSKEGGTTRLTAGKIALTDSFYNGGHSTFVMDADSTISFGGKWTNEGMIVVDLANATKNTYKLADNLGMEAMTLESYGKFELANNRIDARGNGIYALTVVDNDLFCRVDQPNQLVANDFQAIADPGSYDPEKGTFTVGGVKYEEGLNAFKTLHDANEMGMMTWVTNVHVYGLQHMDFAMSAPDPWTLELHDNAILTIGVDSVGHLLSCVTNTLAAIRGTGSIAFGKKADEETEAVQSVLKSLCADGSKISIASATVEPITEEYDKIVEVNSDAKVTEDGVAVVDEILNPGGNVTVEIAEDAKGDTLVAGNVVAKDQGEVTVVNASEKTLAVAGAVEATDGTVTVRNESTGVLSVAGGIKASVVTVDNYGHFESDVTADAGVSITNRSAKTIVGTLKGTSIDLTGIDFAAISNVTVEADRLVLEGENALTGPLTLKATSVENNGCLAWNVSGGNCAAYLNDFKAVYTANASFAIIANAMVPVDEFAIASNATEVAGETFALIRGETVKKITVDDEKGVDGFVLWVDAVSTKLMLKVPQTQPLEVTVNSESKPYDGTPLTADGCRITGGALQDGERLVVKTAGEITDVGTTPSKVKSLKVMYGDEDRTGNYVVTTNTGLLTVTKAEKPLVIKANPPRVADGSANGFSYDEDALFAGETVAAEIAVTTNENGTVVCSVARYAVLRGTDVITANYDIVTEDSTVETDPNAEYTVVASSKEMPKVAKGEEVTIGSTNAPAIIDIQAKSMTFTVGANATYALVGEMRNAKTVKVTAGAKAREDGKSVQKTTTADLGSLRGTSSLTSGSYTDVTLGYLSGTEKANSVTVGSKSVFAAGDIDLGAGSDKLSVGTGAAFEAGDLYDVESLAFGSCSTNEIGDVFGVQKLMIAAGKAATKKAEAVPTMLVAGDVEMISNKANTVSLGKDTESSFGDVLLGEKNDKITVGDDATALFGCIDFGGGKDTLTVGKNSTVVMVAYEDDCASLTKFTVGKGTTAYLSSELIARGKKLSASFGRDATIVDIGTADIAREFKTTEVERLDNAEKTAQVLSGDVTGWLCDIKDAEGVALDGDDVFVADRDLVVNVTVAKGHVSEVSLYVNGSVRTSAFGRDFTVNEGDVIRLHKGKGDAAASYVIEASLR